MFSVAKFRSHDGYIDNLSFYCRLHCVDIRLFSAPLLDFPTQTIHAYHDYCQVTQDWELDPEPGWRNSGSVMQPDYSHQSQLGILATVDQWGLGKANIHENWILKTKKKWLNLGRNKQRKSNNKGFIHNVAKYLLIGHLPGDHLHNHLWVFPNIWMSPSWYSWLLQSSLSCLACW